jgi:hypothetical protein
MRNKQNEECSDSDCSTADCTKCLLFAFIAKSNINVKSKKRCTVIEIFGLGADEDESTSNIVVFHVVMF